jgi:RND family efflux transporter MFP subunit
MKNYEKAFFIVLTANVVLLALLAAVWWNGRSTKAAQTEAVTQPGSGPLQVEDSSAKAAPSSPETPLAPVQLSAERLQSIGVRFGTVTRKSVQDEIRVTGNVAVDETRLTYVQTRFSGYIQKVFADATYKYVRKGQPLFTIYSPELATAEREYLVAKQNAQDSSHSAVAGVTAGFDSLLQASVERLKQWNVPASEISRLESTGQVQQEIEIDSPVSGYITERNALPNLTVQPDTRLYTITDLSSVWVLAQVFQNDLGKIHKGEAATLTVDSYPGKVFRGRVDFIYPDVDMATRTARVRLVFSNSHLALSPGMFVNVSLQTSLGSHLVVPAEGVLQSGLRQIVFVDRGDGYLEPREVQLGPQAGDEFIVLKGLKAGERVVTSANFLIDSESQLQAAIGSFVPPPPGAGVAAAMNGPQGQAAAQAELLTKPSPPRKGANVYQVKLTNADGSPITGAQVSVRSYMPGMPEMGMAAMNVVTQLGEKGPGVYEGNTTLESGGTWQITVTASKNGAVLVTKKLSLNATGGM